MTADDPERVLVVIPTYNEIDNLEPIVERVRSATPDAHVLIVDDNSPDGTGDLADKLAAADEGAVHTLHRPGKGGLGAAYVDAFHWALDHDYDAIVEMDADGSHAPEELPRLLRALREADLVLGSRYVPGGAIRGWATSRMLLSRAGNLYTRMMLRLPLRDATGGYRVFRAGLLRGLTLGSVASQGYCFQVDLAWRAYRAGYRVVEVPITFTERERGSSKMSQSVFTEALWRVTGWGLSEWTGRARKRPDGPAR